MTYSDIPKEITEELRRLRIEKSANDILSLNKPHQYYRSEVNKKLSDLATKTNQETPKYISPKILPVGLYFVPLAAAIDRIMDLGLLAAERRDSVIEPTYKGLSSDDVHSLLTLAQECAAAHYMFAPTETRGKFIDTLLNKMDQRGCINGVETLLFQAVSNDEKFLKGGLRQRVFDRLGSFGELDGKYKGSMRFAIASANGEQLSLLGRSAFAECINIATISNKNGNFSPTLLHDAVSSRVKSMALAGGDESSDFKEDCLARHKLRGGIIGAFVGIGLGMVSGAVGKKGAMALAGMAIGGYNAGKVVFEDIAKGDRLCSGVARSPTLEENNQKELIDRSQKVIDNKESRDEGEKLDKDISDWQKSQATGCVSRWTTLVMTAPEGGMGPEGDGHGPVNGGGGGDPAPAEGSPPSSDIIADAVLTRDGTGLFYSNSFTITSASSVSTNGMPTASSLSIASARLSFDSKKVALIDGGYKLLTRALKETAEKLSEAKLTM